MPVTIEQTMDMTECHAIRREVFILEQQVPEAEEWDEHDTAATHFLISVDGQPIGTTRVRILDDIAKLERIALREAGRGKGYGEQLLSALIKFARTQAKVAKIMLSAQTQALPFYEKQGFTACSDIYMEAGIAHRLMDMPAHA